MSRERGISPRRGGATPLWGRATLRMGQLRRPRKRHHLIFGGDANVIELHVAIRNYYFCCVKVLNSIETLIAYVLFPQRARNSSSSFIAKCKYCKNSNVNHVLTDSRVLNPYMGSYEDTYTSKSQGFLKQLGTDKKSDQKNRENMEGENREKKKSWQKSKEIKKRKGQRRK